MGHNAIYSIIAMSPHPNSSDARLSDTIPSDTGLDFNALSAAVSSDGALSGGALTSSSQSSEVASIELQGGEFDCLLPSVRPSTLASLERLIAVVAQLRHPEDGCPWDLAQTPQSLIPYVLEEAHEVVDALRRGDIEATLEELGDLLLQVVLQAQVAQDLNQFCLEDVVNGLAEKLIRRHPHVFAGVSVRDSEDVRQRWEAIKATEKGRSTDTPQALSATLARYAQTLPPLTAAMRISRKAAQVGFEWENVEGVWDKFHEELAEFQEAIALGLENREHQESELGDLLFTIVNLGRWYGLDPEAALAGTNRRFVQRFSQMEAALERPLADYSVAQLEALWQVAKAKLAANAPSQPPAD